jgi:hypothetical protein
MIPVLILAGPRIYVRGANLQDRSRNDRTQHDVAERPPKRRRTSAEYEYPDHAPNATDSKGSNRFAAVQSSSLWVQDTTIPITQHRELVELENSSEDRRQHSQVLIRGPALQRNITTNYQVEDKTSPVSQGHGNYHNVDKQRLSDTSRQPDFGPVSSLLNNGNDADEVAAGRTQSDLHLGSAAVTPVGESKYIYLLRGRVNL